MSALPPHDLIPAGTFVPPSPAGSGSLSRRRKAAIVVRFLIGQGARLPLDALSQDLQIALTHELAGMRAIDKETLDQVLEEFTAGVEGMGLSFPGGA